jgi:hypothetical protein
VKNVGSVYNDNGSLAYAINGVKIPYLINQAIRIDPFDLENFFINYRIKTRRWTGAKIQFAANNLAIHHYITGVTPFVTGTPTALFAPNSQDLLNLMPGRSFTIPVTGGWAPKR